jgi:hypothetical protein
MNRLFAKMVDRYTPQVNDEVMNGLACTYMKKAEEYVDEVFRSAAQSFPEGLEYTGYERCTPLEEYEEVTRPRNNKRSYDIAKSDIYLVKYRFSYMGTPLLSRHIFLPYVLDGGILSLGGSKYHITPVLSDKVISPGIDTVFVRLLRDRCIFKRCYHSMVVNGRRETSHVVWSQLYRKLKAGKKVAATTKANTSMVHYLFAKLGFTETFKRYVGFVPIAIDGAVDLNKYPTSDWVILESSKVKPKTFISEFYTGTNIKLLVPREQWTNEVKGLCIGFFYIVDHFPTRFKASPEYLDNTSLWMITLGHIIFSGIFGENKLYTSIKEHFISLDDYVDPIIMTKLKESGYVVNDFYGLLMLIIGNFNNLILDNSNTGNSMYGKSLEVLSYVLYDITSSIFRVNFSLGKLATKKPLSENDIIKTFNKEMKQGDIFKITSGKIFTESVSYSGDHKYFKITSKIAEQESTPGATRGKSKRRSIGIDKHLDISMIEAGSVLFISKSNPSPTNRINPFVKINLATGTIYPNPEFDVIREQTMHLLKGVSIMHAASDINAAIEPEEE